ncbi:MAG: 2OG-Fe(II) oxygenase [Bacteroidota bacterium]
MEEETRSEIFDELIDHLAEEGFFIWDNFLSPSETESLRSLSLELLKEKAFTKAGIGRNQNFKMNDSIRGDHIFWLNKEIEQPVLDIFYNRISEMTQSINRTLYLGINKHEFHFAIYPPGKGYNRHLDAFTNSDARKISIIIYLNDSWQEDWGGQLRLYLDQEIKDYYPIGGRMICMRSDLIEHEVMPVTKERYSLTGWLRADDPLKKLV